MSLTVVNPATGETTDSYETMPWEEVDDLLDHTGEAQAGWRRTDFEHRAERMRRAAAILRDNARAYGELMTAEMGKPVESGVSEAEKCAWVCDYYADHAADHLARQDVETPDTDARTFVAFEPIGIVMAIMPWNFPFWQVFRFAAPTLMAGNAGVLKHASNVPGCALAIEAIFREAGFPEHLFRSLLVERDVTNRVIEDPRVRAVTLTGSVAAGKAVASRAGGLVKKTVLELGGSDPYLVLEDADLDLAVETCVKSRLINSGQSCIAAKRFLVVEPLREEFEARMVARMREAVMGDPMEEAARPGRA